MGNTRSRRAISLILVSLFGVGFLIAGTCAAINSYVNQIMRARLGPVHVFDLEEAPAFLPDDMALARAMETMAKDGYDLTIWEPVEDDRTRAPNGSSDLYLSRNTLAPNSGSIRFWCSDPTRPASRYVHVELKHSQIECQVGIPK